MCGLVSMVGRVQAVCHCVGVLGCSLTVHVPSSYSNKGEHQALCPVRQQCGSSSMAQLPVVERIMCAVVKAPTAVPASVMIDCRYPRTLVDCLAG